MLNDLKKTCLPFSLSLTTSYIFQFHIFVSFFTYSFLRSLQSTFSPKEATKTTLLRHQSFPDVLVCFPLGVLPHSFLLLYQVLCLCLTLLGPLPLSLDTFFSELIHVHGFSRRFYNMSCLRNLCL